MLQPLQPHAPVACYILFQQASLISSPFDLTTVTFTMEGYHVAPVTQPKSRYQT